MFGNQSLNRGDCRLLFPSGFQAINLREIYSMKMAYQVEINHRKQPQTSESFQILTAHCSESPLLKHWTVTDKVFSLQKNDLNRFVPCGIISPNTTIPAVAPIIATVPEVKSSRKIVSELLTRTFPSKRVHKRKLPRLRTGNSFLAYFFSSSSP